MEQKKGASRIAKWDNARWILITLVVICHFFENYLGNPVANSLFFYVYTFHMPAFFLIAGLFSKKTVEDRRIDKVAPYILIYIFIKIVNWIVQMIIYGKYTSINWFVESGVAWFALAMFFMYIITFYTKRFKPVYGFVLSVVIAMILGYTVENTDIFCWLRIVNFYPFFYLGYVISIEDITKWLENKKIKVMAIISLITYFVICCVGIDKIFWLRFLLTGRSGYYRLEYGMAYGPLIRLGVYVISFFIVFMFLSIMPKRRFILSKIGQRSLSVYVFHYVFIYIYMASSLYKYLPYKYPNKWWLFIVAIGIAVTFICGTKWPDALCKWIMNSNIKYMNSYDNNGQINNYNNSYMNEPEQRKIPYVTAVLVAINVVVFLVMEFFGSTESGEYMYAHGASYAPDIFENGQWYRILTSMFMHFGAEHLINNMVMLYILGYQIEENFGRVKYLITYFICGIAGGIISSGIEMITGEYSISAGASGAIFGIFGVLLVMIFKSRKQLGQVSAPRLILLFILMVFGNMQEGVDWMAHLGGAVTGVVIALAIYRPGNKPLHL